jgi:hypothetical protein
VETITRTGETDQGMTVPIKSLDTPTHSENNRIIVKTSNYEITHMESWGYELATFWLLAQRSNH